MSVNIPGLISIIIFYLLILIVGLWASRKKKNTSDGGGEEAMLAGRNIGLFVGIFTMTATWVGGGYINGTAESVYSSGLIWAQAPWGYSISLMLGGLLFAKKMREREYVTMLDPLQEKYGNYMGGLLYIPALLGESFWSASILGALGATLSVVLEIDVDLSVMLSAVIAVGYTLFGGLYAVAYTDVVQLICIFLGLWVTVPFALTNKHVVKIEKTETQWLGTWDPTLVGEWSDYALHLIFGGIPWQVYFQRVLSSKSATYAQGLSFAASFGCILSVIPALLLGAAAKSADWAKVAPAHILTANGTISDTRFVLPMVLQYLTPTWISFFGLGAISAAVMSSADSSVLSVSSMFAHNIYKVIFRPKAKDREIIWVIRVSIVVAGVFAVILARTIKSIYALFSLCSDLVYVLLFPQLLCAVHVPFVNTYGSIAGYIVGLIFRIGGGEKLLGIKPLIKYPFYRESESRQLFPFRTLSMCLSLASLILVSYLFEYLLEKGILDPKYDLRKTKGGDSKASYDLKVMSYNNTAVNYDKGMEMKEANHRK